MIFSPKMYRLILAGKKHQTRRLVKDRETVCRYHPGRTYALQPGRGKRATLRLEVLGVEQQRLGEISFQEARAEGFKSRDEFFAYWAELHGTVDEDLQVWAIAFALVPEHRFLAKQAGQAHPEQYVETQSAALPDEPEAVSAEVQEELTAEAHERGEAARIERLARHRAQPLEERLRWVRAEAARSGVDLSRQIASIEQRIRAAEHKVDRLGKSPSERVA